MQDRKVPVYTSFRLITSIKFFMILTFNYIAKVTEDTRAFKDRRFKVKRVIASYTGADGNEYRKSFESKGEPTIPKQGTHEELNNLKQQF